MNIDSQWNLSQKCVIPWKWGQNHNGGIHRTFSFFPTKIFQMYIMLYIKWKILFIPTIWCNKSDQYIYVCMPSDHDNCFIYASLKWQKQPFSRLDHISFCLPLTPSIFKIWLFYCLYKKNMNYSSNLIP
jgi:hypothetical protein